MYVNPFWVGVAATIFSELVVAIAVVAVAVFKADK